MMRTRATILTCEAMASREMESDDVRHFRGRNGFTLTELLVVMGIVGILGAMTALGYRAVAKDAKLASGKNTIMAVLDNARGLAMKHNQIVMVVFRPRLDGKQQYIEAITAKWAATSIAMVSGEPNVVDRYVPIANVPARALPTGIMIAGPYFTSDTLSYEQKWATNSNLPAINQANGSGEVAGQMIGVMYAPDGSTILQNSNTDSSRPWVDFNIDSVQQIVGASVDYFSSPPPTITTVNFNGAYFDHVYQNDEPFVGTVPYLAVIDNDVVRESYDTSAWLIGGTAPDVVRRDDYSAYINENADRIHFNRYTGVAMK